MSESAVERLARLKADVPVLPCWYCEGKDGDGEPYDPKVHHGWSCEACDERRKHYADLLDVNREYVRDTEALYAKLDRSAALLMDSARAFLEVQRERDEARKALRWIVEDSVYKAPEEHNWLSRRYAQRASGGYADSAPNGSGSNPAILPLDTPDDAPGLRRAVEKVRDDPIAVVAKYVLGLVAIDAGEQWENHPEIGEMDWEEIAAEIQAILPKVTLEEYEAAYKVLAARADNSDVQHSAKQEER